MTEATLSCYTRRENGSAVLVMEGSLDVSTSPRAEEAFQDFHAEHGPDVILDLSRLHFIDSKGVGTLLTGAKLAREGKGRIYLDRPTEPVRRILEMCGLSTLFPPRPARAPLEVSIPDSSRSKIPGSESARRTPRARAA